MDPTTIREYVRASNGDGEAVRAIITTDREIGDMSIITDSVLNFPQKFIATIGTLDVTTGLLDPDTMTIVYAHLDGSIITIDDFAPGYSDTGNVENQVVILKPTTAWADAIADAVENAVVQNIMQVSGEAPGGTKNGINTVFTLAATPTVGTLALYLNGIRQKVGVTNDYTISGNSITMSLPPASTDVLLADYWVAEAGSFVEGMSDAAISRNVTGDINGTNTIYTTPDAYIGGTLEVYINGLKQLPGVHFSETTPASGVFTMSDAPLTGDNISCNYHRSVTVLGDAASLQGQTLDGIVGLIYPVGSIYTSTVNTNPAILFGIGTWVVFGSGKTLVGVDTGQTEFDTVEETGGAKTHTLTEDELPSISGSLTFHGQENGTHVYTASGKFTSSTTISNKYQAGHAVTTGANSLGPVSFAFGSGNAHNNLQPYITVYFWKRTA